MWGMCVDVRSTCRASVSECETFLIFTFLRFYGPAGSEGVRGGVEGGLGECHVDEIPSKDGLGKWR